jgi:sulfopyruvate decarboxylase TPP-binding subunit
VAVVTSSDGRAEREDPERPGWVAARAAYEGIRAGGSDFAVYLPDSVLYRTMHLLESDPDVTSIVCSREDEGIGIAVGASLAGRLPVALMEGSGLGYCGLILARAIIQRTSLLVIASHSPALGERFDFHASSRMAGQATFEGLHIPYVVIDDAASVKDVVRRSLATVQSQRTIVGILVPPFVMSDTQ